MKDGKFTNGDFADPAVKPSFIPAETINLVFDNLDSLITLCGEQANNEDTKQLAQLCTSNARAKKIVLRDENGNAQFSAPIVADDAANKAYTDSVQENLTAHENTTNPHGATISPTADRLAMFDGNGFLYANSAPNKDTSTKVANTVWVRDFVFPVGCFCTQYPGEATPATKYGGTWTVQTQFYDRYARGSGNSAEGFRAAGLPNISGSVGSSILDRADAYGAFSTEMSNQNYALYGTGTTKNFYFNASRSSGIYGASGTVQPADYPLVIWKRTA